MKSAIDSYLFGLTDKLAFLSLEEVQLDGFGEVPADFAVPVFVNDIRSFANGQEGFSTRQIATAMLYILGIDQNFKFNGIYMRFLRKVIDKPEAFAVELGMNKHAVNSNKDALIYLRSAMALNEEEVYPIFNYAQIAFEFSKETSDREFSQRLLQEAKMYFKKAISLKGKEPLANYQLGRILLEEGKTREAMPYIEIAAAYGEEDLSAKARTLQKDGLAMDALEQAEDWLEKGDYEKAVAILESADTKDILPNLRYQILYAKGFGHKALGDVETAIDCYTDALALNNQDSLLLAELGMSYALLGDFEQALELYLAALDLEQDSIELMNNISIIYLNLGNLAKAKEYAKMAKELDPGEEIVDETIKLIRTIEEQGI